MKKYFPTGGVALTLLVIIVGALTLYAGDGRVFRGANGESGVKVDGVSQLSDKTSSTSAAASSSSSPAFFSLAGAKVQPMSASCNPGQCKPMTAEQCAAAGYEPGDCIRLTPDQCAAMGIAGTPGTADHCGRTAVEVRKAETGTAVSDI